MGYETWKSMKIKALKKKTEDLGRRNFTLPVYYYSNILN